MEIKTLYKLGIFSLKDLIKTMSISKSAAAKAVLRWQHQGLVRPIRRNMYTTIDLATDKSSADKFEVASHISPTSYVGWHTALEYHGLGHQAFFNVFVGCERRFNSFNFDGVRFEYCAAPLLANSDSGVIVPSGNPKVRVTDLERTLIDCIDRLDRVGGVEELLHCLEGVVMLDDERMKHYLQLYSKAFLYQKVGFILKLIQKQARISDEMIGFCHKRGTLHVKRLTNAPDSNRYIKTWKLYVPDYCLTQNNNNHDII